MQKTYVLSFIKKHFKVLDLQKREKYINVFFSLFHTKKIVVITTSFMK